MPTPNFRTGNGADWLDLLSSRRGRYRSDPVDDLETPRDLDVWLGQFGYPCRRRASQADLMLARRVRESLHALTVAVLGSAAAKRGDIATVNQALAAAEPPRLKTVAGTLVTEPATEVAAALAAIARGAVETLTGPDRESLHACGDDTCSGIFLDRSGRRRWCTDERCGNRMRVRAYREARRSQPA